MILKKAKQTGDEPIVIDLTGPSGNAFVLMGTASKLARRFGYDGETILKEMRAGDYEHLLRIFEGYFGERVIMYR